MTGKDTCVTGTLDGSNYYGFSDTALANEYHRYGLLWTEDKLEFYLDGVLYCTYIIPDDMKDSFDAYVILIFTLNYYTPEFAEAKGVDAGTYFENHSGEDLRMEIDYVRIYQSTDNGSILIK
jgi:beta-glucanase (GH16 family)